MPVVPTRSPVPSVATAPLPGVRLNPSAPDAAFRRPAPVDFSGVTDAVAKLYQQHRQHADQVAVLDADTQLTQFRSQFLSDPRNGILAARGKNALDSAQGWETKWRDGIGQIRQGLTTDEQRDAFDRLAHGQFARAHEEVETHVAAQLHHYEQETVNASLDTIYDEIVQHADQPDVIAAGIEKGRAVLTDWTRREGMSPEQQQHVIAGLVSKAHVGVIDQRLATGNDLSARKYFDEHAAELSGADKPKVEEALQSESTKGEAQRQADRIMRTAVSFDDGMTQAAQITNPGVREATERRVRQGFDDKAAAARQARDDAFGHATQIVQQTGDFDKVPWSARKLLSPTEESSLRHLEDQIRHPKRQTDMGLYATLMNMAGLNPQTRQDFEQLDLTEYRAQLDDSDFDRLVSLQLQLRTSTQGADKRAEEAGLDVPKHTRPADQRLTVPQPWLDSANTNPRYRRYLEHMRVLTAAPDTSGDIDLTGAPPPPLRLAPVVVNAPTTQAPPAPAAAPPTAAATPPVSSSAASAAPPVVVRPDAGADASAVYEKNGHLVVDTPRRDSAGHVPTHRIDQETGRKQGETWTQYEDRVLQRSDFPAAAKRAETSLSVLEPDVEKDGKRLIDAAKAEGHKLVPRETRRSQDRQEYLFQQGRSRPGDVATWTLTSDHANGRAIDFGVSGTPKEQKAGIKWLNDNAARFGFDTLAIDPGHVAKPIATVVAQKKGGA